jgi:BlaI family penicillinase repressor
MLKSAAEYLSRREQQIMEIIYQMEHVTAADVMRALPDTPSNSAVRTHLRILERKGFVQHLEEEGRYVYRPTRPRQSVARFALSQLLQTFFDGSVEKVMAALLSVKAAELSQEELDRLKALIDQAGQEGR